MRRARRVSEEHFCVFALSVRDTRLFEKAPCRCGMTSFVDNCFILPYLYEINHLGDGRLELSTERNNACSEIAFDAPTYSLI